MPNRLNGPGQPVCRNPVSAEAEELDTFEDINGTPGWKEVVKQFHHG
jgi:hypothetical protein